MKNSYILIVLLIILSSCSKKEQFTITGTLTDTTKTTIYLLQIVNGNWKNIDSTMLTDGKFILKGKVNTIEEYYLKKSDRDMIMLFIENCPISVTSDTTLMRKAIVKGGEVQELYNSYLTEFYKQNKAMETLENSWEKEQNPEQKKNIERQLDSMDKSFASYQEKFIFDHPSSPVAITILTRIQFGKNAEELSALLSKLDTCLYKNASYKAMSERVDALKNVAVGKIAPDFTMNNPEGNPVTLSAEYIKNKYTLIDFWASWCGPCREENPNVVAAFQRFNKKGFSVFGVSLDNNKDRWTKAITDDKLTWQHVSDLKAWNNSAAILYAVNSIPTNFLIDQKGSIIAVNLRGEELMKKLEEELK